MTDDPVTHSPFSGRWIARIGNKIICQGGSPDQAFKAAKSIRGKETIIISYIPFAQIMTFPPLFYQIQKVLSNERNIYLVGGAVRNALLAQKMNDLDFAVPSDVERVARLVSRELKADIYPLDQARESFRLILHLSEDKVQYLDFSRMRGTDIDSDLLARDLTINAMAVNINDPQKLIDPLGGAQDLREKKIKACSSNSIQDDPIRILRAVRFAAVGGYKIEDETRRQLKSNIGSMRSTSPERIRDELFKILNLDQLPVALRALEWLGAFPIIFPDIHPAVRVDGAKVGNFKSKLDLTSAAGILRVVKMVTLRNSTGEAGSLFGGLVASILGSFRKDLQLYLDTHFTFERDYYQLLQLSDLSLVLAGQDMVPNAIPESIAREMNLSREEMDAFQKMTSKMSLVENILRTSQLQRRDAYLYFKATGSTGVALTVLYLGRMIARQGQMFDPDLMQSMLERTAFLWDSWWNKYDEIVDPKPFVNGDEIIQRFDLTPGPLVGKYLEQLKEEQAAGKVTNREAAFDLLVELEGKLH